MAHRSSRKKSNKPGLILAGIGIAALLCAGAILLSSNEGDNKKKIVYKTPLIITKGGHYTGNYRGTKDTAAIWIQTSDTVWLNEVNLLAGAAGGLKMSGGTRVIANNLTIEGEPPAGNEQYGRAIDNYQPDYCKLTHFEIDHTGGILFDHSREGVSPLIQICCGIIRNTTRQKGNGSGGELRAGLQFNTVRNMNTLSEASWIEWYNEPGNSWVEDNFNFYNSSNFKLHNFFIRGAYPYPVSADKYSGSGITADGSPQEGNTKAGATHNLEVYNGTIVNTMNAGANIAAGYHVSFHDLRIISSGLLPDGQKSDRYWSGTCIFNGGKYPDSLFFDNHITKCVIGYVNNGNENFPYKGRQDENKDRKLNRMPVGGNTYLPNPITPDMENSEYADWKAKAGKAGIILGVTTGPK